MACTQKLTREQVYEILEKYDYKLYKYYVENADCLGSAAECYAEYLLRKHGKEYPPCTDIIP